MGGATLLLALLCAVVVASADSSLPLDTQQLKLEVKEMFLHAFSSYLDHGYPEDELKPIACAGRKRGRDPSRGDMDNVLGNYALTLIDSLDSLVVFGQNKSFVTAVKMIAETVNFERDFHVNVFETTIRVLGGLLSAHIFATDKELNLFADSTYNNELLTLAIDLGERLLPAFHTPTGIPYSLINLKRGAHKIPTSETCLAGAGTLQLEFTLLSMLSNDPKYAQAALHASRALWSRRSRINLPGSLIDVATGSWRNGIASIGAGSDSFYEYLLKMHVLTGDDEWLNMWKQAYDAIKTYMCVDDWYLAVNMGNGEVVHGAVDSLMAFLPSVQVLAGDIEAAAKNHLNFYRLWNRFSAMPENFDVRTLQPKPGAYHGYPLRPEFVESTYYLYRATKDPFYLEVGRRVVQDLNAYMKTACGFAAVADVTSLQPWVMEDRMDSFFLSETLKYLYLLFDEDNFLNKGEYIFNTEGHPIPLSLSPPIRSLGLGVWDPPMECSAAQQEATASLPKTQLQMLPLRSKSSNTSPAPASKQQQQMQIQVLGMPTAQTFQIIVNDPAEAMISAVSSTGSKVQFQMQNQMLVHVASSEPLVALPALFGPSLVDTCIHSLATFAEPIDGCTPYSESLAMRVVVVERGHCDFVEKVTQAQKAGATAVIVCATPHHMPNMLISMQAEKTRQVSIDIPSFYLSKPSCDILRASLLSDDVSTNNDQEAKMVRIEASEVQIAVELPLAYPAPQSSVKINTLINTLLQALPRLPHVDLTPPPPPLASSSIAIADPTPSPPSHGLSSCTVQTPSPPSSPSEECPWPDRLVTRARLPQTEEAAATFDEPPVRELRDYVIAPPLIASEEGEEEEARKRSNSSPL